MTEVVDPDAVSIVLTDAPSDAEVGVVSDALDVFNSDATGIEDRQPLAVLVKDPTTGETLGGITGRTSLGLWFVDLFYLPALLRGAGLGRQLLEQAETEARKRGCTAGFVYTINFQAPDFYKSNGWVEFGRIPSAPEGTSRIFLTKALDQEGRSSSRTR